MPVQKAKVKADLTVVPPRLKLHHKKDSMVLENDDRDRAVFWYVSDAIFTDSPFCIEIPAGGRSGEKHPREHKEPKEYIYQVLRECPDEKKPQEERKGGGVRPADPVIIMDIDK